MKNPILFIVLVIFHCFLYSCSNKDVDDPIITYYFTTSESELYEYFSLDFNYSSAIQNNSGKGDIAYRTIYIDPKPLEFTPNEPTEIYLGQSSIETREIKNFDINIGSAKIGNSAKNAIDLQEIFENAKVNNEPFQPNPAENITVIWEFQLEESINKDDNGILTYDPMINVIVKRNQ